MAKILILNRIYPPRFGADGRLLRDVSRALIKTGHHVHVITSGTVGTQSHSAGKFCLERLEDERKSSFFGSLRLLLAMWITARKQKNVDLVITLSNPPLLYWVGNIIARSNRAKHIHWCHEVQPDLIGTQYPWLRNNILKPLIWYGRKIMARVDAVVAISGCMQKYLQRTSFLGMNLTRIDNWPDPACTVANAAPASTGDFRVLYVGGLNSAHPLETILNAAAELHDTDPDVRFIFSGRGEGYDTLIAKRGTRSLENVRLLPPQPAHSQIAFFQTANVHLVTQSDASLGQLLPSKALSAVQVKRPFIFIGPNNSDWATKSSRHIRNGDAIGLAAAIRDYKNNPDKVVEDGIATAAGFDAQSAQNQLVRWLQLVEEVLHAKS